MTAHGGSGLLLPGGGRSFPWVVAGATGLALALRLAYRIDYAEETDSIRFLEALRDFDVARERPHFPGYPVFILIGRAALLVLGDPVVALATACAACGGLLVIPAAILARVTLGERAGAAAALFVAVNPLLWLSSEQLLSDMPGLLALFSALAVLAPSLLPGTEAPAHQARSRLALGFFLLGITLGIRLSYFPFLLSAAALAAWRRHHLALPATAAAAGVLAWAIPLLVDAGAGPLLAAGMAQGAGHFERFGGTVVTEGDLAHRAGMLAWELLAQGLGTWWNDRHAAFLLPTVAIAGLALLALPLGRPTRRDLTFWGLLAGPYLAWIFLGQNVAVKARHALPLVVLLVLALAAAAARAGRGRRHFRTAAATLATVIIVAAHAVAGLQLAREHRDVASNAVRLSRLVARLCGETPAGGRTVVYTATLDRHLARNAPCAEVVRLRRVQQVMRDLARRERRDAAFVVSDVARVDRLPLVPVATFRRNRYIQNALNQLTLYRVSGRNAPLGQPGEES